MKMGGKIGKWPLRERLKQLGDPKGGVGGGSEKNKRMWGKRGVGKPREH